MTEGKLNILDSLRIAAIANTVEVLTVHLRSLGDNLQGFVDGFVHVLIDFAKDVSSSCKT